MTSPIAELDFDNIKQNIINHFKQDPVFSDYNFEGSALNAIIDILAYNTHTNSYYANMLHNESFIDTAQKRSSVVSIAKELGYVPASASCATAYVNVNVTSETSVASLELKRGSQFASSNESGNHNFIVADTMYATFDNGYLFSNVKIVAGILVKNTYTVDTATNLRSIFTIPNKNVDISTVKVFVNKPGALDKQEFTVSKNAFELTSESTIFFIQESYDGYYQIYFGNDILGVQPVNNDIITIEYIISNSVEAANGCRNFLFNTSFTLPDSAVSVTTTQSAFGGKVKESIDSIRFNAIRNNSAKERAVTVEDYNLILKNNFSFIKNSIVWGGENNVPPVYGKVFISAQPVSGYTITDDVKNNIIKPLLRKYSMLTITHEIVDPDYTSLEFVTRVKFNKMKTVTSELAIGDRVKNGIKTYLDSTSTYNKAYYESVLISQLTALDPGIVSIDLRKKIGFNIAPPLGIASLFEKTLNNQILENSVTSGLFNSFYNGSDFSNCYIKEIPNTLITSGTLAYKDLGIYSSSNSLDVLITKIGFVDLANGYFKFTLNITSYISTSNQYISIRCRPVNMDIVTKNNQILSMDSSISGVATIDNIVYVENYVK